MRYLGFIYFRVLDILDSQKIYKFNQYVDFLSSDEAASTKFWEMDKRIKQDKKTPGVCMEINKREILFDIVRLLKDGVITFDDLVDFSDELKENVKALQQRVSN